MDGPRRFRSGSGSQRGAVQLSGMLALAGVVVGGLGVGFVGQRVLADESDPASTGERADQVVELAAHDCPDGAAIGVLHSGDQVFVTARTDDGAWLRIRNPLVTTERWWVAADGLEARDPLEGLPVADCDGEIAPAAGDPLPDASTPAVEPTTPGSAPGDSSTSSSITTPDEVALPTQPDASLPATVVPPNGPSTSVPPNVPTTRPPTTRPTTTTRPPATAPPTTRPPDTTTVPPDRTGPSLQASLGAAELWEADGGSISCGSNPRSTTVSATVSDPSGVASVVARWQVGNHQGQVTLSGGGTRTGTVGPHPYRTIPSVQDRVVVVTVTATDGAGNQSSTSASFTLHSTDWCFG